MAVLVLEYNYEDGSTALWFFSEDAAKLAYEHWDKNSENYLSELVNIVIRPLQSDDILEG